ncbi:hypothetical protein BK128_21420 [Viridibacillus sp. FSL H7-0596]|nr:hypothetical protein BK128_21420 [Viridibacillus sp. FSL H7-0596]
MYQAAFDNGNSCVKGILNAEDGTVTKVKQKTIVSSILTTPTFAETSIENAVANLMDNMIVYINSKAIKKIGLFAVGEKANTVGDPRNMNIRIGKKHKDDIPVVMSLSIIAATAVQEAYRTSKELPREIEVSVDYSSALPATEFSPETAKDFEKRFLNDVHMVSIYVTSTPINVNIKFNRVKITQEGNPAVFAIVAGDSSILNEFNSRYDGEFVNSDFQYKKMLNVDIGDGTTEFIYTVNGKPQTDLCVGERMGVGHAADNALKLFKQTINADITMNRQQFMNAVLDESHNFHVEALYSMKQANIAQSQAILEKVEEMYLNKLQGDVNVITVFGGGAAAFKDSLQEELVEFANSMNCQVLWIPNKKAPYINVTGLDFLNKKLFFKQPQKVK